MGATLEQDIRKTVSAFFEIEEWAKGFCCKPWSLPPQNTTGGELKSTAEGRLDRFRQTLAFRQGE